MALEGSVAIVTGGGTGVGRATGLELARLGCSVVVNYCRSQDDAERTVAEINAGGARAVAVQADVAQDEDCRKLVEHAAAEFGRLDVLINNAGTTRFIDFKDLDQVTAEVWDQILAVNTRGPFQMVRAARSLMIESGGGQVVNVTSVAGLIGAGSSIPYAASKAALNNMTLALARTLAPKIRVNAVAPGFITGRWLEQGLGPRYEEVKRKMELSTPTERVCEPEDVAAAIMSLVCGSQCVTGHVLVCDAGMLLGRWGL